MSSNDSDGSLFESQRTDCSACMRKTHALQLELDPSAAWGGGGWDRPMLHPSGVATIHDKYVVSAMGKDSRLPLMAAVLGRKSHRFLP